MKKMCRCFKEGYHGFLQHRVYLFSEVEGGGVVVIDPPVESLKFESLEEFNWYFIEIDDKGHAVHSDQLVWVTEGGRGISIANMTSDFIIQCIIWLGSNPITFIKDGVGIHEWMLAFGSELEKRKGGEE